jgi:hypothetical protein
MGTAQNIQMEYVVDLLPFSGLPSAFKASRRVEEPDKMVSNGKGGTQYYCKRW